MLTDRFKNVRSLLPCSDQLHGRLLKIVPPPPFLRVRPHQRHLPADRAGTAQLLATPRSAHSLHEALATGIMLRQDHRAYESLYTAPVFDVIASASVPDPHSSGLLRVLGPETAELAAVLA